MIGLEYLTNILLFLVPFVLLLVFGITAKFARGITYHIHLENMVWTFALFMIAYNIGDNKFVGTILILLIVALSTVGFRIEGGEFDLVEHYMNESKADGNITEDQQEANDESVS